MAHSYDLSQPMDEKLLTNNEDIHSFDFIPTDNLKNDFTLLYNKIKSVLEKYAV